MNEQELRINLDDPDIMVLSEAAELWDRDNSAIRKGLDIFPYGTARSFGKVILVTREGMEARYDNVIRKDYKIDLHDPDILVLKEAAKDWGKDDSYMRRTHHQFIPGTIRKFGNVWLVTREGMEARYGKQPEE